MALNQLFPDPSPLIPRSENISTLRIFCPIFDGETVSIQENKVQTVWGGISATGGIWTFLNGFFAMVFGQSLFHIFFGSYEKEEQFFVSHAHLPGSKQVSIFGIAHHFQRKPLRDGLLEEYPNLLQRNSDYGLVDLLREYVVDLEIIKGEDRPIDLELGIAARGQDLDYNHYSEGTTFLQHQDKEYVVNLEIIKGKDRPPVDSGLEMAVRGQDLGCNHNSEGTALLQHQDRSCKDINEGKSILPADFKSVAESENVSDLDHISSDPARGQDNEDCTLLQHQDSLRVPR